MLIKPDTPWPLPGPETMRQRWRTWQAWWSGDLEALRNDTPCLAPGGYWARKKLKGDERQMHLPLASDIPRTSAELLFGDQPRLEFNDGIQDVWDEMAAELGWANSLLESAEVDAAIGGVYLRPQWDSNIADTPLLTTVRPADAIPTFRFDRLATVTFVTVLEETQDTTWRWLEHHEPGQIRHELWRGTKDNIGRVKPLTEHDGTKHLAAPEFNGGVIDTRPIRPRGLLVEYVPNDLPQPLALQPYGKADIQSAETFLDALDETWDSWMRDIRLGKARILASQEMLDSAPTMAAGSRVQTATGRWFAGMRGNRPSRAFDIDAEVFTPLNMPADDGGKAAPITPVQFAIRVQEHRDTCAELVEQIVSRAGYAPQSFGMNIDGQLSGTAMRRRTERSHATKNRKRQYWKPAVERLAETMLLINREVFGVKGEVKRPVLSWPADSADPKEVAETVNLLSQAQKVSTEIAVRMAHPEWDDIQVGDELKRIKAEQPTAPALTGFESTPPDQQPDPTTEA